jgi:hypothetical protein
MKCRYWDCGWCYAPENVKTNATQGGCFEPEYCPYTKQMTEYKCPKWEEVYTKELTLQALFEKLIDIENRMKDEVFILTERIDKLEGELK